MSVTYVQTCRKTFERCLEEITRRIKFRYGLLVDVRRGADRVELIVSSSLPTFGELVQARLTFGAESYIWEDVIYERADMVLELLPLVQHAEEMWHALKQS